jgi:hypothetical protein
MAANSDHRMCSTPIETAPAAEGFSLRTHLIAD